MYKRQFLTNAQGEDVVAGVRTPMHINEMADKFPEAFKQFNEVCKTLELSLIHIFSPTAYYNELTGGTAYYHFLEQLEKNYDSQKNAVAV